MIQFLTGVLGSGKTYYAINYIVKNFVKDEELKKKIDKRFNLHKINRCFTNINELKLDKFDDVESLKFKDFYENLKVGYQAYQDGITDTELNELEEIKKINHSLIVLDECQNVLSKKDDVLIWWLSYARHMYIEVILITQNLALVDSKYKSFSEFFYKAQPSSMRLFKNFMRYTQYNDSTLYNTRKVGVIKVKIIPQIFELYGSGDSIENSSIIKKFIILGVFLLIVMIFSFFAIKSYWMSNDTGSKEFKSNNVTTTPASQVITKTIPNDKFRINDNKLIIILKCGDSICIYKNKYFPLKYIFNTLKIIKKFKILYSENLILSFKNYYIQVPSSYKSTYLDIYNNSKKQGVKNENNNTFISPLKLF